MLASRSEPLTLVVGSNLSVFKNKIESGPLDGRKELKTYSKKPQPQHIKKVTIVKKRIGQMTSHTHTDNIHKKKTDVSDSLRIAGIRTKEGFFHRAI